MPLARFRFRGLWAGAGVLTFAVAGSPRIVAMAAKFFISQGAVDGWVTSDLAELSGHTLTFRAQGGALELAPALLFLHVSAGKEDPHDLVGKVLDEEAILALGGETYMSSVLLGETAYDVEPGFVGVPSAAGLGTIVATLRALDR